MGKKDWLRNLVFKGKNRYRPESETGNKEPIKVWIHSKHPLAVQIVTSIIHSNPRLRDVVTIESSQPSHDEACGKLRLLLLDTCSTSEWPELLAEHLSSGGRAIVLLSEELASRIHLCHLFHLGACAVISMCSDFASELPQAILSVAQGATWMSKTVTESINRSEKNGHQEDMLTARQQLIMVLLRQGLTNRQLAMILGISERTVKFHVSNIMHKLRVTGRLELRHFTVTESKLHSLHECSKADDTAPIHGLRRKAI